jgi:hypothetical protein
MATPRLYVARDDAVLVVSRQRLRTVGGRTSLRRWSGAVETSSATPDPEPPRSLAGAAVVAVPPALIFGLLLLAGVDVVVAAMVALTAFFAFAYLAPVVRRAARRPAGEGAGAGTLQGGDSSDNARLLFDTEERAAFDQALDVADRISDTWPQLGGLVDPGDAGILLASALWDLSGVLVRRQQVRRVLADLNRSGHDERAVGETAGDLEQHRTSAARLLTDLDADIARRIGHLAAAERAGRDVIREREARRAVDDAARSLRGLAADRQLPQPTDDAGSELAERTETVLAAYRELIGDADRPAP